MSVSPCLHAAHVAVDLLQVLLLELVLARRHGMPRAPAAQAAVRLVAGAYTRLLFSST